MIVLLALAGGGYYFWQELQKSESTDDAEIDGHIIVDQSARHRPRDRSAGGGRTDR